MRPSRRGSGGGRGGTHAFDPRPTRGRRGEDLAARHLEGLGYRVAARNVRIGRVELDLVLRRGSDVVFCEVKTRRGASHGVPEEAVDARKQTRIVRAAAAWLARHPARGDVRFDVLSVLEGADGGLAVRHLPDAFRPW